MTLKHQKLLSSVILGSNINLKIYISIYLSCIQSIEVLSGAEGRLEDTTTDLPTEVIASWNRSFLF